VVDAFIDFLEQGSNGQIQIEAYAGGALVPSPEILTACGQGTIDVAWYPAIYQPGMIPEASLFMAPLLWQTPQDVSVVYWEKGWDELIKEIYAEHNARVIGYEFEGTIATWGTYPINTLDDFKGKMIRFFGDYSKLVEELGASTMFVAHEESYTALTLGTVDGYGTSMVKFRDMKHYEVCKYLLATPMCSVAPAELILNMDQWNALPDNLKALIDLAGREFAWHTLRLNRMGEFDILARAEKEWGVTVTRLSEADEKEMRQVAIAIWDETAAKAGPRGQEMMEIAKQHYRDKGVL